MSMVSILNNRTRTSTYNVTTSARAMTNIAFRVWCGSKQLKLEIAATLNNYDITDLIQQQNTPVCDMLKWKYQCIRISLMYPIILSSVTC